MLSLKSQEKHEAPFKGEGKEFFTRLWAFLNRDLGHSFLDADVGTLSRSIAKFLNQDIVGQKIIFLDDGRLNESSNALTIFLKRKRYIKKKAAHNKAIEQLKKIYQYFNHPFWQQNEIVTKQRVYLKNSLRRITPTIIENLTREKKELEAYFRIDQTWDNTIFQNNLRMKQNAMDLGYKYYTFCQAKKEPLALNNEGDVFCLFSNCKTHPCPFQAIVAHGEEIAFLKELKKLLLNYNV